MKILFLNPRYFEENYRVKVNKISPPLGMAILANILLHNSHEVMLLDLEGLKESIDEKMLDIKKFMPDIIGIFGTSPIYNYIIECSRKIRNFVPSSLIIIGGPCATFFPEKLLEDNLEIDYVFRGEAENSLLEFVKQIEQYENIIYPDKIPGICYRTGNSVIIDSSIPRINNIDDVPMPAYNLLNLGCYFESGSAGKTITMMTSRGCPNKCIYCVEPLLYGHKFRGRSPENVVDEMKHLHSQYGIDHIVFYDATFNHDKNRVKKICHKLIEKPIELTWRARVRADKLDREMVRLMKLAGCVELSLGVETGTQRLLDILRKNETIEEIKDAFQMIKENELWSSGYFMFGIPSETQDDMKKTIEFAIELDPDWALFSAATPFQGTEFFNMVQKNIITSDIGQYKFNFDNPVVSYGNISNEQIAEHIRLAYKMFYLRKEWVVNRIKKAKDNNQIENIINSYLFYLKKETKNI